MSMVLTQIGERGELVGGDGPEAVDRARLARLGERQFASPGADSINQFRP
jgi:hypothetical protein